MSAERIQTEDEKIVAYEMYLNLFAQIVAGTAGPPSEQMRRLPYSMAIAAADGSSFVRSPMTSLPKTKEKFEVEVKRLRGAVSQLKNLVAQGDVGEVSQ